MISLPATSSTISIIVVFAGKCYKDGLIKLKPNLCTNLCVFVQVHTQLVYCSRETISSQQSSSRNLIVNTDFRKYCGELILTINLTSQVRCNFRCSFVRCGANHIKAVNLSMLIVCIASTCARRVIVPISLLLLRDTVAETNVQLHKSH